MKVRLPTIIKDPRTTRFLEMRAVERFEASPDELFLDGPVGRRVAVIDFDPDSGLLSAPVPIRRARRGRVGGYEVADPKNVYALDLLKVSVFGTVLKTMRMFEEEDTLGRPLVWAFNAPQLLIIPRAGVWANAYYERDSHSLQFFYFPSARAPEETIYTALSHDIVSHETGHAILDGIAPDLYDALTPQGLALHEAVADLTALLMAFRSKTLSTTVLNATRGLITDSADFSGIAREFAAGRDTGSGSLYLRNLNNNEVLDRACTEPHVLSEVLSGALYAVMLRTYQAVWDREAAEAPAKKSSFAGRALFIAAERFKRLVFRALDYLPPGEIAFADYARAILAADQASHPDQGRERDWIAEEFVRRNIVAGPGELQVQTNCDYPGLNEVDLQTLVTSDWAAYEFANRNREFLGIPPGRPFRVRPRLDVTKLYYHREKGETGPLREEHVRECVFKASWDVAEANRLGHGFPRERQLTFGTTLAIDWQTKKVRALLTSRPTEEQAETREQLLRRLAEEGLLKIGGEATGPDGQPRPGVVRAEVLDGLMRVRGTARMLHVIGEMS